MNKPFLIGITGGSASGKTHFLKKLLEAFSESEICLISQDNYYNPRENQPVDVNGIHNFDTPDSIDFKQYEKDILALKKGKTVYRQEYTYNNPAVKPTLLEFQPAPVIIAEGIFIFYSASIYNMLDLKIFIDAKEYIKLKRRIIRDNSERGYDLDDVLYRYEQHVAPTYEKYIEPFKYDADFIIPNNKTFEKALEVLVIYLKNNIINKSN
ncbi:MAG: uridine kinase [Bacteroidota bacterium]|nr:uridine kinase [Bacteroidota bacterium]